MKVTEHVGHLLRQVRKPKELTDLGKPKSVVTKVRRQLRGKAAPRSSTQKGSTKVKPLARTTPVQPGPVSLDGRVQQFESRMEVLEAISAQLVDLKARLDGTPALGLKHHFKCDCGGVRLCPLCMSNAPNAEGKPGGAGDQRNSNRILIPLARIGSGQE